MYSIHSLCHLIVALSTLIAVTVLLISSSGGFVQLTEAFTPKSTLPASSGQEFAPVNSIPKSYPPKKRLGIFEEGLKSILSTVLADHELQEIVRVKRSALAALPDTSAPAGNAEKDEEFNGGNSTDAPDAAVDNSDTTTESPTISSTPLIPKTTTTTTEIDLNPEKIADALKAIKAEKEKLNANTTKEEKERRSTGEIFLPEGYSKYEIPKITLGDKSVPVPAGVLLHIRSILEIDEDKETLLVDMDFVILWLDGQLFRPENFYMENIGELAMSMPPVFIEKVWMPDLYLDNLERLKKLKFMSPPIAVTFNQYQGSLIYKERLVPLVKCGMDFHYYPADTQVCEFSLRSYAYGTNDLILTWLAETSGAYLQEPVDANFDLRIDDVIETIVPDELGNDKTNKTYYALQFKLYTRRKLSYHVVQTYLPSVFFICITWLCFLLPTRMVEARLGITMTTLLTLTAMFSSVRDSTPTVSYVKAIDIWMVICIFFIFLTENWNFHLWHGSII